jgi:RES domain-containing protein
LTIPKDRPTSFFQMAIILSLPDISIIQRRLMAVERLCVKLERLEIFRFSNPNYSKASDIVSGEGARYASGRWHPRGACRLSYTSTAPETALAESLAHVRYYRLPLSKALPSVLVALRLTARRVLDLRVGSTRQALRLPLKTLLQGDWRKENQQGNEAVTQAWGRAFGQAGFEAVLVPSTAHIGGTNVLVFPENLSVKSKFSVVSEVK